MRGPVYLAGPFFNSAQVKFIAWLEEQLEARGIPYFSPRLSEVSVRLRKEGFSPQIAAEIFAVNLTKLDEAEAVLAVLDWLLPPGRTLALIEKDEASGTPLPGEPTFFLQECQIPDSGTVWELGVAYANDIPSYVISTGKEPNLMLIQGATGVLQREDQILALLDIWAPSQKEQI